MLRGTFFSEQKNEILSKYTFTHKHIEHLKRNYKFYCNFKIEKIKF